MKESLLELDPQADALLILQKPNAHSRHNTIDECTSATSMICHFHSHSPIPPESEEDDTAELPEVSDEMRSLRPYLPNGDLNQIVFRVSAKHLCLASPVFQRMIYGRFKESEPNDQGLLEIRTSEWDAEALLILLDIIHGHHSSVPKRPSLDVIAQIGVIADYYDCLEVVRIFFQDWHSSMKIWEKYSTRPPEWGPELGVIYPVSPFLSLEPCTVKPFDDEATIGLFMAWIVQDRERFRELTASAVLSTNAPLETALPIPARIIGTLFKYLPYPALQRSHD
ncbi:hypothetical protein FGLOB1_11131 [Fusarium globosum]|uniref:BTB domain-containing protein n=1 Tax=Fusarium globosum TaxID=78864 RepID=A0A8H6D0K0_9HYPO|nr:hypothetical protein FGLOB1_11131 [Fusarium globosum]